MAVRKGNPMQNDEGPLYPILDPVGPNYQVPIPPPSTKNNPAAKSQWSTGRGCPRDGGQLVFMEVREEIGVPLLRCSVCSMTWVESNFWPHDNDDPTVIDNFNFRHIPEDTIQRWMDAREREKKKSGEWD